YPVDIAVFENNKLKIICECKKISSQEGKEQLRKYLRMCEAKIGVWFNGKERIVLKKVETKLKPRENLKSVFHQIKKSLQKTVIGSTNEPDIAKNVLKILFCKIFDERYQSESGFAEFYANIDKPQESSVKIRAIFTKVKNKFEDVFDKNEEIKLDDKSVVFIVQKLQ
ncbi:5189_t:CDS:2, partial [Racocetra persica]